MRIISMPPIYAFEAKHPIAAKPLNDWYRKVKQAKCQNLNELKKRISGTIDYVGRDLYIFNIGGNNFRILAAIHFNTQLIYIRAVLTHRDYDIHNKNGTLLDL